MLAAVAGLRAEDGAALEAAAERIAAAVLATPLPEKLAAALAETNERLCFATGTLLALRVAVRSSALGENARDSSIAVQFESYLGIAGHAAVALHVRRVWAILFGARALPHRLRQGRAVGATPMAVVVLEPAKACSAGGAFSLDPMTGRRDRVVIEDSWGWGEAVVTPDRVAVKKADFRILAADTHHTITWGTE